ncbi:gustatory receptor for sugar taste 64e-like [Pectinophora gossypiella]|uniref:gustatory receptor for sugar taste 64e-like n=1 Tax=Pectinophora gossypiella TaxID=13191 RepID=UPI00214E028F|nr:gustatory receptor for sugar taste 64e-like [Pectinophora gossypiella]
MLLCFCVLRIFKESDAPLSSNTAAIFYACNGLITIQFLNVAKKWTRLCRHIAKIEAIDPSDDNTVVKKCNISCIVILILGAVEHGLSDLSASLQAVACHPERKAFDAYLMQNFSWVWAFIPYNSFLGVILKSVPSSFWRTMREDYTKATNLVRQVDDVVSGIIFVSFASNLFSICFLLLHTLEPLNGYEHASYFMFSIVFLIIRSLAVSLIAARVNSASCETAYALYEVPSASYCVEVQRFIDQIHGDTVGLSGLQFFSVKRGMVLTIAATIVTYELVLIQFTGVTP